MDKYRSVNAVAESCWVVFKTEYYHRHTFATIADARRGTYTWIDGWYNARRRPSGIGYISPQEYERRQLTLAACPTGHLSGNLGQPQAYSEGGVS